MCRPPLRSSPSFPAPRGVNPDKARRPALPVSRQDCSRDNSSRQCNRLGFSLCRCVLGPQTPAPRGVNPDKAHRPALPVSEQDCPRNNSGRHLHIMICRILICYFGPAAARLEPQIPAPRGVNPDKARRPAPPVARQDCSRHSSGQLCFVGISFCVHRPRRGRQPISSPQRAPCSSQLPEGASTAGQPPTLARGDTLGRHPQHRRWWRCQSRR